ncbi:MBL fold metallo-hydrolase [Chiayiivirga flava]|uniref:Metallo-beta-lactamase family protein n=1 Tax=Chiayiivirga flava TaxID=659595 RepID=A0A7W8D4A8_9GAMM|nr:MBL fold metallo-hydrolase [Chiayiivirga flava]MBB5206520.1 metallo-beta-lactamase family protein [Chiayiivirga flava]
MSLTLRFLGAAETVTGSRYLLCDGERQVLVDCGLFQGYKSLRLRNREDPGFDPAHIAAVILTHAHLDHSGWLPRLHALGFDGPIYCTPSTLALCRILLPDAGRLQEEDARYANAHGFSKHRPALPLFTEADALRVLARFRTVDFGDTFGPTPALTARLSQAGHLLGAASVHLAGAGTSVLFSGDLGRQNDPIMPPPAAPPAADHVVIESTYGNRVHTDVPPDDEIAGIVAATAARAGSVIIPSFAVGRAQALLLILARLMRQQRIPRLPAFLDSPMAIDATAIYLAHRGEHRLDDDDCRAIQGVATMIHTADESRQLNRRDGPMIVVAASGMATGGRVLHHLRARGGDPRNAIVLCGYQAGGTRGAQLANGERTLRIHGQDVEIRAQVHQIASLSAHADAPALAAWLQRLPAPPRRVFVTHGEPDAADALRRRIGHWPGWSATVPRHGDEAVL